MSNKTKLPYYNFDKVMSFNAFYMFICGARGLGKTYGAKYKCIKAALTKGEQFVYLRRYKPELQQSRNSFFDDIYHEFPDWDFRIFGDQAQFAPKATAGEGKKRVWHTMGFFIALSTAQSHKGRSFPKVTKILFDEFIIEKGNTRYLPHEHDVFNNFYSTVDRNKDKTRVFFLANSVSMMNPYFLAYDIVPDTGEGEIQRKRNGYIVAHFPESKDFQDEVYKTAFGRFIAGTDYADYAVGNTFRDNHKGLIAEKPSDAEYKWSVETPSGTFSVWVHWTDPRPVYYVLERRPKKEKLFTLLPEMMDENRTLLTYSSKLLQYLRTSFSQGNVLFDSAKSRNAMADIFKR